jgi:hypothetical protein
MATIGYLSVNVWAKGWLTEPKLVLLFDPPTAEARTLSYALYDPNGVQVTDTATTTIPAGTSEFEVVLGDYLDAQQTAKGYSAGLYFIIAKIVETNEVFALPLIVTISTLTFTPPEPEYLTSYSVIDTVTGAYLYLPKTLQVLPTDPRFMVFLHYHRGNKGRLIGIDEFGNITFDTGYHQLAYITLTLKFDSTHSMLMHMLSHSYGLTKRVALEVLKAVQAGRIEEALKLLRPFYSITFTGRVLTVEFDTVNYEIKLKTSVFLGQWDWAKIFSWGTIGCGLAVAGAVVATAVTAGIGAVSMPLVAGACLAGGAVGAGLAVVTSASSDQPQTVINYYNIVHEEAEKAKETNKTYYNEAVSVLSTWLEQGKITQDDFNEMKRVLDSWKASMDSAIDDIVNVAKKAIDEAYNEGYKKGVEESKMWILGAGLGGLVLGFMLGRR